MEESHETVQSRPAPPTLLTCSPRPLLENPSLLLPEKALENQQQIAEDKKDRQSREPKHRRLERDPRLLNNSVTLNKGQTRRQIRVLVISSMLVDKWPKPLHPYQCQFLEMSRGTWCKKSALFAPVMLPLNPFHPRKSNWTPPHLVIHLPLLLLPVVLIVTVRGRHPCHKLVTWLVTWCSHRLPWSSLALLLMSAKVRCLKYHRCYKCNNLVIWLSPRWCLATWPRRTLLTRVRWFISSLPRVAVVRTQTQTQTAVLEAAPQIRLTIAVTRRMTKKWYVSPSTQILSTL